MTQYILAIIKDVSQLDERCIETNLYAPNQQVRILKVVNDIKDTLRANPNLVALAAPQIGIKDRVFCIRFANGDIRAFINPMIVVPSKDIHLSRETCASLPGKEYIIPRSNEIEVAYQTPTLQSQQNKFLGAPAEVFQQMVNLLDGIVLSDIGLEVLPGFDDLSEEDKTTILNMYIDSLKSKTSSLEKEIKTTPELEQINKAIDFLTDVAVGKVKVEKLTKEDAEEINTNLKKYKATQRNKTTKKA